MGCDGSLYAFSLFLPTIIKGMGYKNTHAQLLSVPPYAVAAVMTITIGYIADRTGKRGKSGFTLFCLGD
jgi:MFS family permease